MAELQQILFDWFKFYLVSKIESEVDGFLQDFIVNCCIYRKKLVKIDLVKLIDASLLDLRWNTSCERA